MDDKRTRTRGGLLSAPPSGAWTLAIMFAPFFVGLLITLVMSVVACWQ
ncbi:MAG TPA: hypothetical protein VHZ24_00525 [Pirellulales bacterium]|jgi:hypothetical protein|nr:hypothetical protein [Pirellulales bacterium]